MITFNRNKPYDGEFSFSCLKNTTVRVCIFKSDIEEMAERKGYSSLNFTSYSRYYQYQSEKTQYTRNNGLSVKDLGKGDFANFFIFERNVDFKAEEVSFDFFPLKGGIQKM